MSLRGRKCRNQHLTLVYRCKEIEKRTAAYLTRDGKKSKCTQAMTVQTESLGLGVYGLGYCALGLGVYGLGHCADGVTWSLSLGFADAVKSGGMLKVLRMQQR